MLINRRQFKRIKKQKKSSLFLKVKKMSKIKNTNFIFFKEEKSGQLKK